jgi:hypothetical protein
MLTIKFIAHQNAGSLQQKKKLMKDIEAKKDNL